MKLPASAVGVLPGVGFVTVGVTVCLPIVIPDAVTVPAPPSRATAVLPLPATTFPNLPSIVTGLSVLSVAPLVKVVTPLSLNSTLPNPVVFVIEVILVKSSFTFTLYVVALVVASVPVSTVVFVPSITFTAFLASFWIIVLPASVMLDKSFLATPEMTACLPVASVPSPFAYFKVILPLSSTS